MNVLMLHNSYRFRGGEDESFESEWRMLRDTGHFVETIHVSNGQPTENRAQLALHSIWSSSSYRMVEEKLKERPYDVLHVQNFFPLLSPSVYEAARKHGVPVVQTLRNYRLLCPNSLLMRNGRLCEECLTKTFKYPGILHACYHDSRAVTASVAAMTALHTLRGTWRNSVDLYVCLTEFSRQKFIEGGFSPGRIVVKSNFVYPDPGVGEGQEGYLLFVGRLSKEKGITTLLEAWDLVQSTGSKLKIVGDGPLHEMVRNYCKRNSSAEWLGPKTASEAKTLMGGASALIFPSEWYETFGRVAIESFAKGTPVIASRLGAMQEIVKDSRTGFLFTRGDAKDLARTIDKFLDGGESYSFLRREARLEYEQYYTAERNCGLLIDIYKNAGEVARKGSYFGSKFRTDSAVS